jgi:hypothetical protein
MIPRTCKNCLFRENPFDEGPCELCRGGSKFEDVSKPVQGKPIKMNVEKKKSGGRHGGDLSAKRVGTPARPDKTTTCSHCGKPCWPYSWCEEMRRKHFSFSDTGERGKLR